jgi:PAS domain S-box-containing protein
MTTRKDPTHKRQSSGRMHPVGIPIGAEPGPAPDVEPIAANEQRFREILESAPSAVVLVDGRGCIAYANAQTAEMLGYAPSELMGMPVDQLVPDMLRPGHAGHRERYVKSPVTRRMGAGRELSVRRRNGSSLPVEIGLSSFESDGERFVVALLADISARKSIEADLRSTAGNFQALIDASPLATIVLTLDGKVSGWNPACERMFGWKASDVIGQVLPHVPADQLPEVREVLRRVAEGEVISGMELRRRHRDGGPVIAELYAAPQRDASGKAVAVIEQLADVTSRRQTETALLQTQKMESIGRLAGGVAHDFNNLITAIKGFAELLDEDLPPDAPEREHVKAIGQAAEQAAAMTQQLLAFSRRQVIRPRVIDPDLAIAAMEPILRRLLGEAIEMRLTLAANEGLIVSDPAQLEQIVMNLAVNARDAMPDGGRLTIETARAAWDEAYASEHFAVSPGDYVMIAISDTGSGMDNATKAHLFEPFFTTKEVGKGTGLGLATVYGAVHQNGGHIWLYSEPGQGTTFKIYMPLASESEVETEALPALSARGSGTILLVEDEAAVRDFIRLTLARRGYNLLVAATPLEALGLVEQHTGSIDLLVSDVVMPGMSGPEMARRVEEVRHDIPALFLSGYTRELIHAGGQISSSDNFLSKPFTGEELARKVEQILSARAPAA